MGLDQYIFHVTKTHYDEQHTFNRSDLSDHVLIPAGEIDLPMYACLKPYCQKLKVLNEYYDVAKMRADHGLSDDAFIWRYTADSITIGDGKHDVEIDDETVRQKYTIQKVEEEYVSTRTRFTIGVRHTTCVSGSKIISTARSRTAATIR